MKLNRIFRYIWRIDGVLIFIAGMGILALIVFASFSALADKFRSANANTVRVETDEGANLKIQLSYGKFAGIEGTNFLIAPLVSEQEYSNFGYGSMKEQKNKAVRNYLFLNSLNQTTHWLLPNNEVLFLSDELISDRKRKAEDVEPSPISGIFYQLINADSNNDGRLDAQDKQTIAFSDANGQNFTELITGVEEILGRERLDDDNLLLIYKTKGSTVAATLKISEKKIIQSKELPKVNE
jgi:hypothetical protein